ncbi:MAG: sigma-54-dependent transcriptional regulator [Acidobacteriota bacterium]
MSPNLRVLVVDDERLSRETTTQQLRDAGYDAKAVENAFQALQHLEEDRWDVVVTDLRMPTMNGLEFLKEIKGRSPEVEVILMTAYGTVETAVAAMHEGAADFLTKPFSFHELEVRLRKLTKLREIQRELNRLKAALDQSQAFSGLVGRSAVMRQVYERVELFAQNIAPVLIAGESGTGKELVARALHERSSRAHGPFVALGCGAIPSELAESEIFGHEKGAFTGAIQRRRGSFERAHRGSLLLDDVDDLPLDIQVKLLRVLQEGTLQRVGAEKEIAVDVRVIATTKGDLSQAAQEGRFREDLFYRLHGLEIRLPPLRERGQDILLLAQHFLHVLATQEDSAPKALSPEAADCLLRYSWPGNVRELRRALESAVAVCPLSEIRPAHLPEYLREEKAGPRLFTLHLAVVETVPFKDLVQEFEDEVIRWAMKAAGGEQQRAAHLLGLPRTTLQSKLAKRHSS